MRFVGKSQCGNGEEGRSFVAGEGGGVSGREWCVDGEWMRLCECECSADASRIAVAKG